GVIRCNSSKTPRSGGWSMKELRSSRLSTGKRSFFAMSKKNRSRKLPPRSASPKRLPSRESCGLEWPSANSWPSDLRTAMAKKCEDYIGGLSDYLDGAVDPELCAE